MLVDLLSHRVTVKRPTADAGIKKTFQNVATGVPCLIQPLDDVAIQQTASAFGKGFRCYTQPDANIREGDQLIDGDSRLFLVRGMRKRNYGNFPHLEFLLSEDKRP
jgi:hypothetical protein